MKFALVAPQYPKAIVELLKSDTLKIIEKCEAKDRPLAQGRNRTSGTRIFRLLLAQMFLGSLYSVLAQSIFQVLQAGAHGHYG